jgi:hypothetical protein
VVDDPDVAGRVRRARGAAVAGGGLGGRGDEVVIVLVLTVAQAIAIRECLPPGSLQRAIAREVHAASQRHGLPEPGVPALVLAKPQWQYVECLYHDASATRCWRAITQALRASGRRRSRRLRT